MQPGRAAFYGREWPSSECWYLVAVSSILVGQMSVAAHSVGQTRPRGLLLRLRKALPRDEFFAGLYIVGCANGLGSQIIRSATQLGDWTVGFEKISVIVFLACAGGISLLLRDKDGEITSADLAIGGIFLAAMAIPVSEANWLAVTALSFYILFFARNSSARRRGAVIMLALTVPMLWSRLLFALCAKFFLEIDASIVGLLLGTPRAGNVVGMADGSGNLVILPACSSLANLSLAFLCWIAATRWLDHRRSREDILWCFLACGSVVAMNVVRISIMGLSRWHYVTFEYGWGATLVHAVILVLTLGFTMVGVRRELFSRA